MAVTRWGICSAGKISDDFVAALKTQSELHEVVAVSARKLEGAQIFAKRYDIPNAYEGHQKLADNPDIDIVYIGSIHPFHHEHSMMMLNAGKHVLCEKPMAMNLRQAEEVINLAKEKKLFFMEGYWSRCFPAYSQIRKEINNGNIGKVKYLKVELCIDIIEVERIKNLELGGGALMDLGCYTIQLAVMVFGEMPHKIVASGTKAPSGVDDTTVIVLHFSDDGIANLTTSCTQELTNGAVIVGTKGQLEMPANFWNPICLKTPAGVKDYPLPVSKYPLHFTHSEGFQYEAKCVHECLKKGATECEVMPLEDSIRIMKIIESVKKQIGLVFPADEQ